MLSRQTHLNETCKSILKETAEFPLSRMLPSRIKVSEGLSSKGLTMSSSWYLVKSQNVSTCKICRRQGRR